MGIFVSMIRKETLHLVRDTRTLVVVLVMPVMLLLLFGFAISTEVNNVRVVAVVGTHDDTCCKLLSELGADPYFTLLGTVPFREVEPMLRRGEADAAVVFRTENGRTSCQIIADAANTSVAQTATAYLENVIGGGGDGGGAIILRTLYNPRLKSAYNFVPGILGMIFILICAMMTSVSIVSEKETGTMNLLLVSPARARTILLGKLVPYFVLSCVLLGLMLLLAYTVLELPLSASVFSVLWMSLLYISLTLALGLLISTLASTQVTALLVSGVVLMIPVIMLSGMIFPIENMPRVLQWLSYAIPARWYISAMRTLMIQQLPASCVLTEAAVLLLMLGTVLTLAVKKFKTRQ